MESGEEARRGTVLGGKLVLKTGERMHGSEYADQSENGALRAANSSHSGAFKRLRERRWSFILGSFLGTNCEQAVAATCSTWHATLCSAEYTRQTVICPTPEFMARVQEELSRRTYFGRRLAIHRGSLKLVQSFGGSAVPLLSPHKRVQIWRSAVETICAVRELRELCWAMGNGGDESIDDDLALAGGGSMAAKARVPFSPAPGEESPVLSMEEETGVSNDAAFYGPPGSSSSSSSSCSLEQFSQSTEDDQQDERDLEAEKDTTAERPPRWLRRTLTSQQVEKPHAALYNCLTNMHSTLVRLTLSGLYVTRAIHNLITTYYSSELASLSMMTLESHREEIELRQASFFEDSCLPICFGVLECVCVPSSLLPFIRCPIIRVAMIVTEPTFPTLEGAFSTVTSFLWRSKHSLQVICLLPPVEGSESRMGVTTTAAMSRAIGPPKNNFPPLALRTQRRATEKPQRSASNHCRAAAMQAFSSVYLLFCDFRFEDSSGCVNKFLTSIVCPNLRHVHLNFGCPNSSVRRALDSFIESHSSTIETLVVEARGARPSPQFYRNQNDKPYRLPSLNTLACCANMFCSSFADTNCCRNLSTYVCLKCTQVDCEAEVMRQLIETLNTRDKIVHLALPPHQAHHSALHWVTHLRLEQSWGAKNTYFAGLPKVTCLEVKGNFTVDYVNRLGMVCPTVEVVFLNGRQQSILTPIEVFKFALPETDVDEEDGESAGRSSFQHSTTRRTVGGDAPLLKDQLSTTAAMLRARSTRSAAVQTSSLGQKLGDDEVHSEWWFQTNERSGQFRMTNLARQCATCRLTVPNRHMTFAKQPSVHRSKTVPLRLLTRVRSRVAGMRSINFEGGKSDAPPDLFVRRSSISASLKDWHSLQYTPQSNAINCIGNNECCGECGSRGVGRCCKSGQCGTCHLLQRVTADSEESVGCPSDEAQPTRSPSGNKRRFVSPEEESALKHDGWGLWVGETPWHFIKNLNDMRWCVENEHVNLKV